LPSTLTLLLPFLHLAGPLNLLETTPPPAFPASSPLDIVISVSLVAVFLPIIFTLLEAVPPSIWVSMAMFGYGIGTGPPGVGVLHTSGKIMHWPSPLVEAPKIMSVLLSRDQSFRRRFLHHARRARRSGPL